MKANELMINDWVLIDEPDKYAGAKAQIKSLRFHQKNDGQYFNVFISDSYGIVRREVFNEDIKPIPLEKTHLTKNGFKVREKTDDTEFYYYDCYEINVSFDEGLPENNIPPTTFLTIEFAEKSLCMPIEYVHELQQAMRFMGCDKEIVL